MPEAPEVKETELSEDANTDRDAETESEDEKLIEERADEVAAEVKTAADSLTRSDSSLTIEIRFKTQVTPAVDKALNVEAVNDPKVSTSDPAKGKTEKAASDNEVKKVAEAAGGTDPKTAEAKKENTLRKFVLAFTLLSLFGPQLKAVFQALTRVSGGDTKIDDLITDATQQSKLVEMAKALLNDDDSHYWASFSSLIPKWKLSAADCVFFLQFTMLLTPLQAGDDFEWKNGQDLVDMVDKLFADYKASKVEDAKGELIKSLPALEYQGLPLPRLIAADLAQRAMAKIALEAAAKVA